jgi:hypothetical protein
VRKWAGRDFNKSLERQAKRLDFILGGSEEEPLFAGTAHLLEQGHAFVHAVPSASKL